MSDLSLSLSFFCCAAASLVVVFVPFFLFLLLFKVFAEWRLGFWDYSSLSLHGHAPVGHRDVIFGVAAICVVAAIIEFPSCMRLRMMLHGWLRIYWQVDCTIPDDGVVVVVTFVVVVMLVGGEGKTK